MIKNMTAIIADQGKFTFAELPAPVLSTSSEVLVQVSHISLNRGEFTFPWPANQAIGWDAAGIVVKSSADGKGPNVGTRVLTWNFAGAWSQYRVVDRHNLALIPGNVSAEQAAALPVVGLTALRALRQLNLKVGSSVAVTGASGGVGHMLIQLAQQAGLQVTAFVHNEANAAWLANHYKTLRIIVDPQALPIEVAFDAVIDTVGGELLSALLPRIKAQGRVLLVGAASGQPSPIDTAYLVSKGIDLLTYKDYSAASTDLTDLLAWVASGRLTLQVTDGGDWHNLLNQHSRQSLARGKRIFHLPSSPGLP